MSKQEGFRRREKSLEKMQEIDNEARISKKAEMKRKLNRNLKCITKWNIQLSSQMFLFVTTYLHRLKNLLNLGFFVDLFLWIIIS